MSEMNMVAAVRMLRGCVVFGIVLCFGFGASDACAERTAAAVGSVRVRGYVGRRLDDCIRNNLMAVDVKYITDPFRRKSEFWHWDTEFWGKFMHSAVPFAGYAAADDFAHRIADGTDAVLAQQLPDGYIGNFREDLRGNLGWDVWGCKYTLLGLMMQWDRTREPRVIDGAKRLADWLIAQFPSKRQLHATGGYRGLASGSLLEPVVLLYKRTGEAKYLDFARYIVSELEDAEEGPKLISSALAGVAVAKRPAGDPLWYKCGLKAYEMMSCYQGLLEYYEATGDMRCLDAARMTAENIAATEMNICGGMASEELWYDGARRQTEPCVDLQETCVSTTWMRLCGKLLELTGDPKWADFMERTFYNAFLASLSADGRVFAIYTPLSGTREAGRDQCWMMANCCNANGPRGFLSLMESVIMFEPGAVAINQYVAATAKVPVADTSDKAARFEIYTHYPHSNRVCIRYDGAEAREFTLKLRVPSWAENTKFELSHPDGMKLKKVDLGCGKAGAYFPVSRKWMPGDMVEIVFDMKVRAHELNGHVAFTRGPIVLTRDCRFGDGDIGEVLREPFALADGDFDCVRAPDSAMWIVCSARLKLGHHLHRAATDEETIPSEVKFCDYASAGNTWDGRSTYRVWLPVECRGLRRH